MLTWSTHLLTEYFTAVNAAEDEETAIASAVERATEMVEADLGAVVREGRVLGPYGFGSVIPEYEVKYRLGNRYNAWFADAGAVVDYLRRNDARLRRETRLFHDTLYDSTLPPVLLDALSSQVSILRSQTSMWLENGRWMAYEGLGCCPMNCTHVYNYAQTLAKLFPELERRWREALPTAPGPPSIRRTRP